MFDFGNDETIEMLRINDVYYFFVYSKGIVNFVIKMSDFDVKDFGRKEGVVKEIVNYLIDLY